MQRNVKKEEKLIIYATVFSLTPTGVGNDAPEPPFKDSVAGGSPITSRICCVLSSFAYLGWINKALESRREPKVTLTWQDANLRSLNK